MIKLKITASLEFRVSSLESRVATAISSSVQKQNNMRYDIVQRAKQNAFSHSRNFFFYCLTLLSNGEHYSFSAPHSICVRAALILCYCCCSEQWNEEDDKWKVTSEMYFVSWNSWLVNVLLYGHKSRQNILNFLFFATVGFMVFEKIDEVKWISPKWDWVSVCC